MRTSSGRDDGHVARPRGLTPSAPCLVICGPTAGGKTRLALALADELELLAVSADSRQIYRGFDIGTAKPSASEQRHLPHACLDLADPRMRFTAYAWAAAAQAARAHAGTTGRVPILVGGAGFYIRALVHPATADAPLGEERLTAHYLVVDPGPSLRQRIAERAAAMARAGWIEEVAALAQSVPDDAPAWQGCGYLAMRDHVQGRTPLATALEHVTIATRQYAKRQRTWFRHQLPPDRVTRVSPDDPAAVRRALAWIRALAPRDGAAV